MKYMLKD